MNIKSMPRFASVILASLCLGACGGGGGSTAPAVPASAQSPAPGPSDDAVVKVGRTAAEIYIQNPAKAYRLALAEKGIEVLSETCFAAVPEPQQPGAVDSGFPKSTLYVYEIRQKDLETARALGFGTDYPAALFKREPRPCVFDPTPAVVPDVARSSLPS